MSGELRVFRTLLKELAEEGLTFLTQVQSTGVVDIGQLTEQICIPWKLTPQRWVLVGEVSSGKSALLNTLLERECLPEGNESTTTMLTRIVAPSVDNSDGTVWLEPYLPADYTAMLEWLLRQLPGPADNTVSVIQRAEALLQTSGIGKEHIALSGAVGMVLKRLGETQSKQSNPVRFELGTHEEWMDDKIPLRWRCATLHLHSKWTELGVEWIDTPGIGHHGPLHHWLAEQTMREAAGILFLVEPRGATREAFDMISRLDETIRQRMVLVFSRIDEFDAGPDEWQTQARIVVQQLSWTGSWYGVSALCARYAREAQQFTQDSRVLRRFEKFAVQVEPMSPTDNMRRSGIGIVEHECVRSPILSEFRESINARCVALVKTLARIEHSVHQQQTKRLQQQLGEWNAQVDRRCGKLALEDRAFLDQASADLSEVLEMQKKAFDSITHEIVAETESRQLKLFSELDIGHKRVDALNDLLVMACRDLGSNSEAFLHALWHWLQRPLFAAKRPAPWIPPNIRRIHKAVMAFDGRWAGYFFAFQAERYATLGFGRRIAQRMGLRNALMRDLGDYLEQRIRESNALARKFMKFQEQKSEEISRKTKLRTACRIPVNDAGDALIGQIADRMKVHEYAMEEIIVSTNSAFAVDMSPEYEALLSGLARFRGKIEVVLRLLDCDAVWK